MKCNNIFRSACLATIALLIAGAYQANAKVLPNNSQMNESEQSAAPLNAEDQGNSKEDLALTQSVRQQIMKVKSFSTDAKNIKVITIRGNITLKGPVKSAEEKSRIEKIAEGSVGRGQVVNELQIISE